MNCKADYILCYQTIFCFCADSPFPLLFKYLSKPIECRTDPIIFQTNTQIGFTAIHCHCHRHHQIQCRKREKDRANVNKNASHGIENSRSIHILKIYFRQIGITSIFFQRLKDALFRSIAFHLRCHYYHLQCNISNNKIFCIGILCICNMSVGLSLLLLCLSVSFGYFSCWLHLNWYWFRCDANRNIVDVPISRYPDVSMLRCSDVWMSRYLDIGAVSKHY